MAAISEGFCIREYVSRMRSVDAARCWPFDGEISRPGERDDGGGVLPPMTCRRFRWWSFEPSRLSGTHQEHATCTASESLEMTPADVELLDGGFGGEDDSCVLPPAASDGQDEGSLGDGRRKAKGRVPKKRSIVEIFAKATEVVRSQQTATSINLQEDGFAETKKNIKKKMTLLKRKKMKKKKKIMRTTKNKIVGVHDLGKIMTKKRKRSEDADREFKKMKTKTKKMMMVESFVAVKPCSSDAKQKLHTLARSSENRKDASTGTQLEKKADTLIGTNKRTSPDARKVLKKDGPKEKRSAKEAMMRQKDEASVLPFSSILKTQSSTRIQKVSPKGHNKDHNIGMFSASEVQQKVRRVRFSDKDDILGQNTRSHPFMNSIRSNPQELSELMAASSLHKLSCAATETDSISEKVIVSKAKEAVCFTQEVSANMIDGNGNRCQNENNQVKDFLDGITVDADDSSHSRSSPELTKSSALQCVDLNETTDSLCMTASQCISQPAIQMQQHCNSMMISNPDGGMQAEISIPWLSNVNTRFQALENADGSDASAPIPCQSKTIHSCLTSPSLRIDKEPVIVKSQSVEPNSASCFFHYKSASPLPIAEELSSSMLTQLVPARRDCWMSTNCFEPVYNSSVVSRGERFFNEDFVGLPLDSRGGLSQMQDQIFRRQAVVTGPTNAYPLCNVVETRDLGGCISLQERVYGSVDHSTNELNLFSKMRYTMNDLSVASGSRSSSFEPNHLEQVEADSESINFLGSRKLNQPLDHKGKEKIDDLDFLNSSVQPTSLPSMRLMGKTVTVGRSSEMNKGSRDPITWIDKGIITEQSPSFPVSANLGNGSLQFEQIIHPTPDPRFATLSFNHNPQLVSKDRLPIIMERYGIARHSVAPQAASHQPLQILGCQVTVNEPSNVSYPRSMLISGSAEAPNHPDYVHSGTTSTFRFPNPDFQSSIQFSSWAEPDTPGVPPWLLNSRIKDTTVMSSQIYCDTTCRQNLFDLPSSSPSPSKSYLAASFPSAFVNTRPESSPSGHYHAHLTPLPSSNRHNSSDSFMEHSSALNSTGKNVFLQRVSGSKPLAFNGGISTNGTRRKIKSGHASFAHGGNMTSVPNKLNRKPTANAIRNAAGFRSLMTETTKAQNGAAKEKQPHEYLQCDASAVSLCIGRDKSVNAALCGSMNCSKTSCTRPGPIKLSAGAKHILKPGQKIDKVSSTMTHSTVPFAGMSSGNNLDSKKKAAKIYRL